MGFQVSPFSVGKIGGIVVLHARESTGLPQPSTLQNKLLGLEGKTLVRIAIGSCQSSRAARLRLFFIQRGEFPANSILGNSGDFQVHENAPGMLSVLPPPDTDTFVHLRLARTLRHPLGIVGYSARVGFEEDALFLLRRTA